MLRHFHETRDPIEVHRKDFHFQTMYLHQNIDLTADGVEGKPYSIFFLWSELQPGV